MPAWIVIQVYISAYKQVDINTPYAGGKETEAAFSNRGASHSAARAADRNDVPGILSIPQVQGVLGVFYLMPECQGANMGIFVRSKPNHGVSMGISTDLWKFKHEISYSVLSL